MVLYVIFSESIRINYKTSVCSKATLLIFFINALIFIIPFLIAYRTQGFWLKSDVYREQPDVHFTYDYLIMLETYKIDSPVICTTFKALFQAVEKFNNCPIIKVREIDHNKDGKNDKLYFEAEALLGVGDNVYSVTLILIFNYKLYSYSWFEMESLGWIEASTAIGAGRLDVSGDLRLKQRELLKNKGRDFRYNTSIVTANYAHEFSLFKLLSHYSDRNITTRIDNLYSVWRRGRDPESPFILSLELFYPEETILYRPGSWHVVKYAWMQYFALLFISILVGRKVKHFILEHRLVHNVKVTPWKKTF